MSRNPNVEAITGLLVDCPYTSPSSIAEWLAAHSCVAVDSLTDEQVVSVVETGVEHVYFDPDFVQPEATRAALRRCATGEHEA